MAETYQRLYEDENEDEASLARGAAAARAMLDPGPDRPGREPSRTP
ncbi:hypothetical protein [Sorangium sp. So ce385]